MKIENVKSHENFGALKIKLGEGANISKLGPASSFLKYLSQNGDLISKSSDMQGKNLEVILQENSVFMKVLKGKSLKPAQAIRTSYQDCFKNLSHLLDSESIKYATLGDNAVRVSRYDRNNYTPYGDVLSSLLEIFK